MEVSQRNSAALQERSQKLAAALVKRFENIVALASPDSKDYNTTANKKWQMEVETAALVKRPPRPHLPKLSRLQFEAPSPIRATEDILTLTRQMQELWLFGNLNTLDANDKQNVERMEQDVKAIIAAIEGLAKETL
ncbi:putative actin-binding cofilin tropomyosin type protein [Lasiodiplodia theobromae]|nr:putative actin-binding cofilin tropomyosin type protein [Lasiodiplodia theobromae]